jgi:aspartate kinase
MTGFFDFMANLKPTVMKFGGTSVEDARAFERVADIVAARIDLCPVVVVSAMSGMTNALVESVRLAEDSEARRAIAALDPHFSRHVAVAEELLSEEAQEIVGRIERVRSEVAELLDLIAENSASTDDTLRLAAGLGPREAPPNRNGHRELALRDAVLAYGELLSSMLLAAVLRARKLVARQVDSRECIITDEEYGCAAPLMNVTLGRTRAELGPLLDASLVPVLGGFIGATLKGETTTIGRGGSDYTASIIGAVLAAREIEIWTDVTGVLTADPRVVHEARTIPRLSYAEAAELAYFGAKVLHPKTMQPAVESGIPVRICNSRAAEEAGTLVCAESETARHTVKAIAHKTGVTTVQVTSARMLGAYGFLRALFEVFERHRTIVDVVTTSEVSVSLSLDEAGALPAIVAELEVLGTVRVERDRAIVCVVGEGLRGTPGIAARVFNTISDINVTLISQGASSINLTFAIEEAHVGEAVNRLHQAFFGEGNVARQTSSVAEGILSASV